jgi:hypothetical protein
MIISHLFFQFLRREVAEMKSVIKQVLDQWDQKNASKYDVLTVVYLMTVYVPSKNGMICQWGIVEDLEGKGGVLIDIVSN